MIVDTLTHAGGDAEELRRLAARWEISSLVFHDRVDSTQNIARALADNGAAGWTVVVADYQESGRGQHGRQWHAAPGASLMFSILLRPRSIESVALIPIRTGLAIARALDPLLRDSARCMVKWPNDIVVRDGKAGGILCEAQMRGEDAVVIVGVGLNFDRFAIDLAERRDLPPAFLRECLRAEITRLTLLEAIIRSARAMLNTSHAELQPWEMHEYETRDWLHGRTLSEPIAGTAAGITNGGELLVRGEDGEVRRVVAGRTREG